MSIAGKAPKAPMATIPVAAAKPQDQILKQESEANIKDEQSAGTAPSTVGVTGRDVVPPRLPGFDSVLQQFVKQESKVKQEEERSVGAVLGEQDTDTSDVLSVTPKHPAIDNPGYVVGDVSPTERQNFLVADAERHLNVDGKYDHYCGFTTGDIISSHTCNSCGRLAVTMLKLWDAGVLVWAKYLCYSCAQKHVARYEEQRSTATT